VDAPLCGNRRAGHLPRRAHPLDLDGRVAARVRGAPAFEGLDVWHCGIPPRMRVKPCRGAYRREIAPSGCPPSLNPEGLASGSPAGSRLNSATANRSASCLGRQCLRVASRAQPTVPHHAPLCLDGSLLVVLRGWPSISRRSIPRRVSRTPAFAAFRCNWAASFNVLHRASRPSPSTGDVAGPFSPT